MKGSIDLYRFIEGEFIYTVNSGNTDITVDVGFGEETYTAIPITRSEIIQEDELSRNNITITMDLNNPVCSRWFTNSLDVQILVTIFNYLDDEVEVEWKGRLTSIAPNIQNMEFTFESVYTSMRRVGLRKKYQVICDHVLYGQGCNLNKEDFAVNVTVTDVDLAIITIPEAASYDDGFFTSGIFEDNSGNLRFIINHVGDQITIIRPMIQLIVYIAENGYTGLTGRLFRGCNRTVEVCQDFNNLDNFGGFPFIPRKNPFSGNSIV